MNAVYVRVSTDEQAKTGYSLQDQINQCRSRIQSISPQTPIQEYVDDGYSGEFLDRPALDRLRDDLRQKLIETVMVYDPDRLSRNLTNQLILADEIEKAGAQLMFITGDYDCSPEGRLFFSIRGAIAAFEKAKIRERTVRGKRAKAATGKIIQNFKSFGYNWDADNCTLTINEKEAHVIEQIYSMCIDQQYGTYVIAREVKRLGYDLSSKTIYNILTKEMYSGDYYQFRVLTKKTGQKTREIKKVPKKDQVLIKIPAIITKERQEAAKIQLQKNKSLALKNTKNDYLLRGLLYCPLCERRLTAMKLTGKRKKTEDTDYFYYLCIAERSNAYIDKRCGNRRIPAGELDSKIWNALYDIARGKKKLESYLHTEKSTDYSDKINALLREKADIERKRADISQWYSDGDLDRESANKQISALSKKLSVVVSALTSLQAVQKKSEPNKSLPVEEILNATTFTQKRNVVVNTGFKIYAIRSEDRIKFWFK